MHLPHEPVPHPHFDAENLAVPEVRTGPDDDGSLEPDPEEIRYEDVAVPEVHIRQMEHRAQEAKAMPEPASAKPEPKKHHNPLAGLPNPLAGLHFHAEDLAVPEVHTGSPEQTELEDSEEEIRYDDVAVPEVHIRQMEHRAQEAKPAPEPAPEKPEAKKHHNPLAGIPNPLAGLHFHAEDLAVPEVHTGSPEQTELEDNKEEIRYDDVAIPEVHIRQMERRSEEQE